jgi:hypothetical protein
MVMRSLARRIVSVRVASGIAAVLRLERSRQCRHVEAELAAHAVEHVVVRVEEPARFDRERYVAVAEVVGGSSEEVSIRRARDRDVLGTCADTGDDRAVLGFEPVSVPEWSSAAEHDADLPSIRQSNPEAGPPPLLVIEGDRERRRAVVAGWKDAGEAQHARTADQKRK